MQAYTDAVKRAKREIILSNAYFIPNGNKDYGLAVDFMTELKKAVVERGVQVKLMTNDPEDNDLPLITWNARWYYPEVLAWNKDAKVNPKTGRKGHLEFYEWNGAGKKDKTTGVWRPTDPNQKYPENTNHAKYGVFDAKEVIVGSFNLDHRSTGINSETVVAIVSPGLAVEMQQQFMRNDVKKGILVTPAQAADWIKEMENSAGKNSDVIRKRLQAVKSAKDLVVLTAELVKSGMTSDDAQKFALTVKESRELIEHEN
jgi:phosphatidylserine/phosphatidylglycerophosphate/cardiolipin synthase-like enzyme